MATETRAPARFTVDPREGTVAGVGGTAFQINAGFQAQGVVYDNARDAAIAKSGVNLDEEAANLVRFQQAYQAAAQIITAADQMFQTLISAVRG